MKKLVNFLVQLGPYEFRQHLFVPPEADEQELARQFFGQPPGTPTPDGGYAFPNHPGEPCVHVASVLEVEDQLCELVDSLVRA